MGFFDFIRRIREKMNTRLELPDCLKRWHLQEDDSNEEVE